MSQPDHEPSTAADDDPVLVDLLAELIELVQKCRGQDAAALLAGHPEFAERLRPPSSGHRGEAGAEGIRKRTAHRCSISSRRNRTGSHAVVAGRLPHPPRGRPGRHGRRLRGRADLARPPRGLKVLPFAAALDPRQLQRFQIEAQAAACLHHTTSCRSTPSAASAASTTTPCSSSRASSLAADGDRAAEPRGGPPVAARGLPCRRTGFTATGRLMTASAPVRHQETPSAGRRSDPLAPASRLSAPSRLRDSTPCSRGLLPGGGPAGHPGGRGARARPPPGRRPPRHQAGQPAGRRAGNLWITDFGLARSRRTSA